MSAIKAIIRLQRCLTSESKVFIPKGVKRSHVAKGRIDRYEVVANSWSEIKSVLKLHCVMSRSKVNSETVESYETAWANDLRGLRKL